MEHRGIEFEVREFEPSKWPWTIYPKKELSPKIIGDEVCGTREAAVAACKREIDNGLDGKNNA